MHKFGLLPNKYIQHRACAIVCVVAPSLLVFVCAYVLRLVTVYVRMCTRRTRFFFFFFFNIIILFWFKCVPSHLC